MYEISVKKSSNYDGEDDDDDYDFDWLAKGVKSHFQPGPLSEVLIVANLQHPVSRNWTCAEPVQASLYEVTQ